MAVNIELMIIIIIASQFNASGFSASHQAKKQKTGKDTQAWLAVRLRGGSTHHNHATETKCGAGVQEFDVPNGRHEIFVAKVLPRTAA